jgi:hypothetical protein
MQNLLTTPLCAIRGDIIHDHKKYFSKIRDCPTCRHITKVCTCKFEKMMRGEID